MKVTSLLGAIACAALLGLPAVADAGCVSNQIGQFTYHNCDNGVSGTSTQIGQFTYHDFDNGVSGTSTKIGQFTYHNLDQPSVRPPVVTYPGPGQQQRRLGSFPETDW